MQGLRAVTGYEPIPVVNELAASHENVSRSLRVRKPSARVPVHLV